MVRTWGRTIAALLVAIYWPVLFILAHIRMPDIMNQVQASDKVLHFLAYLLLVFLLWSAVKPFQKVVWSKPPVWWLLLLVVGYGVIDEWLQGYTGRTPDVADFLADLAGAITSLVVLSVLDFWLAAMAVLVTGLFAVDCLTRGNLTAALPAGNQALHLIGYALLTALWAYRSRSTWPQVAGRYGRAGLLLVLPVAILTAIKLVAWTLGKRPTLTELGTAGAGILIVTVFSAMIRGPSRQATLGPQ